MAKPNSIEEEMRSAGERSTVATQSEKKNYAERLSRNLALRIANELRPKYVGILPDESGAKQESRARTAKGFKKLDVNYSTLELGLALGVSIKTINFPDIGSGRYTKNFTRVDNELRSEAADYHQRQPYAVMIALIFLPDDAYTDGRISSFGQAVKVFRYRTGRKEPDDDSTLFEKIFVGAYSIAPETLGDVSFFDVERAPPKRGVPTDTISLEKLIEQINRAYEDRNRSTFVWADQSGDTEAPPTEEVEED